MFLKGIGKTKWRECPTVTAVFTIAIPLGGPWYWLALSLGLELLPPLAARFLAIGMIAGIKEETLLSGATG